MGKYGSNVLFTIPARKDDTHDLPRISASCAKLALPTDGTVMAGMSQKVRFGVLELRTEFGSLYANPSFWERMYLLWTFRNFRILSKQVLNRRQQQLIDKLCELTTTGQQLSVDSTCRIGIVENLHLAPNRNSQAVAISPKLVEISNRSAHIDLAWAAGSEGMPMRSGSPASNRAAAGRRLSKLDHISAPAEPAAQTQPQSTKPQPSNLDAGRMRTRKRLEWGLLTGTVAVLLAAFFLQSLLLRRLPKISQPTTDTPQQTIRGVASTAAVRIEQVQPPKIEDAKGPAVSVIHLKPSSPTITSGKDERFHRKVLIPSEARVANSDSTPPQRMLVAEAPASFSYPRALDPNLSGKVRLKAVISDDGNVRKVDVLSGNRTLADAAVRAVRQWRYRPHELMGHAVEAETLITISFMGDDVVSVNFRATQQ